MQSLHEQAAVCETQQKKLRESFQNALDDLEARFQEQRNVAIALNSAAAEANNKVASLEEQPANLRHNLQQAEQRAEGCDKVRKSDQVDHETKLKSLSVEHKSAIDEHKSEIERLQTLLNEAKDREDKLSAHLKGTSSTSEKNQERCGACMQHLKQRPTLEPV